MFKPFNDNVVIRVQETQNPKSELVIPDSVQEKPSAGKVIAVGPGRYEYGALILMTAKENDLVVWTKGAETKIKYGTEEFVVVSERDLLVSVKEK